MRIITGSAKGTLLSAPAGENTRPTSDRAKEGVFSILQFSIEGRSVLDLFSGSGQMALEALSRGACRAVAVDSSKEACSVIAKNAEKTRLADRLQIICGRCENKLDSMRGNRFDIVFIDPPYDSGLIPVVLKKLALAGLLSDYARVVCESRDPEDVFGADESLRSLFITEKTAKYGIAWFTLLRPSAKECQI